MANNKYRDLYNYCQSLSPVVGRNQVKQKTLELTGTTIRTITTGLDTEKCRGLFFSAKNRENRWVQQCGTNVIVLARGMNRCWDRLIFTKELMHLFDDQDEATSDGASFESLLNELAQPGPQPSAQILSEAKAIWMALACLCPEKEREEFKAEVEKGHADTYAVALKLRIPKQYVPHLFAEQFPSIISRLTS